MNAPAMMVIHRSRPFLDGSSGDSLKYGSFRYHFLITVPIIPLTVLAGTNTALIIANAPAMLKRGRFPPAPSHMLIVQPTSPVTMRHPIARLVRAPFITVPRVKSPAVRPPANRRRYPVTDEGNTPPNCRTKITTVTMMPAIKPVQVFCMIRSGME